MVMREDFDGLIEQHRPEVIAARLQARSEKSTVSDAVLGGIDGCVTTFAIVSGVIGAGLSPAVAVVLGFANLVADGFSMAVSNYESAKADMELNDSLRASERDHIERIPEGEREEIRQIFAAKGFSGETLDAIVETITADQGLWIETMMSEEHGVARIERNPLKAALTTFAAFTVVGLVPLLPFLIPSLEAMAQFSSSAGLAAIMFFSIGALKSRLLSKPMVRTGLGTLLTGGTAAGLAFLIGYVLREAFGIALA